MKANRTTRLTQDDRAQVGIGTMIVFIATILVAATAAAVLIDTSGKLQERSSATGNQATEQVASNLIVKGVYGVRPASTGNLEDLNLTLSLAPGASSVDLSQAKIMVSNGAKRLELDHAFTHGQDKFVHSEIRDPKGTIDTTTTAVMTAGGLVNLQIDLNRVDAGLGMTLGSRTSVTVMIIPEVGSPVHADFVTPPSFGSDQVIVLR